MLRQHFRDKRMFTYRISNNRRTDQRIFNIEEPEVGVVIELLEVGVAIDTLIKFSVYL